MIYDKIVIPDFDFPKWIYTRRIKIYREGSIKPESSEYATKGVEDFLDKMGLTGFSMENAGENEMISEILESSLEKRKEGRSIVNFSALNENLKRNEIYDSNACVILANRLEDSESDYAWVRGDFDGLILLKLQGKRQENLNRIYKVTKKGMVRLLGYRVFKDIKGHSYFGHSSEDKCLVENADRELCNAC